jgi:hypothetical protein
MPHTPTHDPFSDEAIAARRRLRTIQQNLGPFAEFVQRDPEQFAAFAEETADQIGQAAGFTNGVSIADPETFASFIGQSSAQFEAETGSPSPIRQSGMRAAQESRDRPDSVDETVLKRLGGIGKDFTQNALTLASGLGGVPGVAGSLLSGRVPFADEPSLGESFSALTDPNVQREDVRFVPETLGARRVAEAGTQLTSFGDLALTAATAGVGPAIVHNTASPIIRAAAAPIVSGGLGTRLAAETAAGLGAVLGSQELAKRAPDNPVAQVAANIAGGLLGAVGGVGAFRGGQRAVQAAADPTTLDAIRPRAQVFAATDDVAGEGLRPINDAAVDAWQTRFEAAARRSGAAEKFTPFTPAEQAAFDAAQISGDWRSFSVARGYTEREIMDFQITGDLVAEGKRLGLHEDDIFAIEGVATGSLRQGTGRQIGDISKVIDATPPARGVAGEGAEQAARQADEVAEVPTRTPTGNAAFEVRPIRAEEFTGNKITRLSEATLGKGPQPVRRAGQAIGEQFEQIPEARIAIDEHRRIIRTSDSRGNLATERNRRAIRGAFQLNDDFAIPSLQGIDPTLPGAPTLSDVAARLPLFLPRLSQAQRTVLTNLAEELAPMQKALEEVGIDVAQRNDIMEGGFYLPRGNATKEGLDAPASFRSGRGGGKAGFERAARFDSGAQGISEGAIYVPPWEATGDLVRHAGRRIADEHVSAFFKQLKDEQGRLLGETPRDRLLRQFPEISTRMSNAQASVARLKGGLGRLNARQNEVLARFIDDPNFAAENADDFTSLAEALESIRITRGTLQGANAREMQVLLDQTKTLVRALRPEYRNAVNATRGAGLERGSIQQLSSLNGRAFPQAFANEVNKLLDPGEGIRVLNATNNLFRGINATLDNSAPGIQGLVGLADDQKAYGRALSTNIKAWGNEDVLAKFVDDFDFRAAENGRLSSTEWTNYNLRFGGAGQNEFTVGQGALGGLGKLPGIRHANRAFAAFGDSMRLSWADDMLRDEMKSGRSLDEIRSSGDLDRIANIANNMTGWADGRSFSSVGDLLLFAPRFLQSRLNTLGKAFASAQDLAPGRRATIDQRNARRSMLKLIGGAVLLTEAANRAQGRDTDYRFFVDGKKNSNFLRVRAFGRDWSLLGTWDSLAGAIANVATGNPGRAIEAQGSFATNFAANVLFGEEDFIGRSTKSPAQKLGFMLESMTPFATEELPSAIGQIAGGDVAGGGATLVGEVFGAKSSQLSFRDRMDDEARALGNDNFDSAPPFQQTRILGNLEKTREGRSFLYGLIDAEPDFFRVPRGGPSRTRTLQEASLAP